MSTGDANDSLGAARRQIKDGMLEGKDILKLALIGEARLNVDVSEGVDFIYGKGMHRGVPKEIFNMRLDRYRKQVEDAIVELEACGVKVEGNKNLYNLFLETKNLEPINKKYKRA